MEIMDKAKKVKTEIVTELHHDAMEVALGEHAKHHVGVKTGLSEHHTEVMNNLKKWKQYRD